MTVPKFTLTGRIETALAGTLAEVIVVGTVRGAESVELADGATAVEDALDGRLLDTLSALGASGKADEVVKIPTFGKLNAEFVLAVGLGDVKDGGITAEQVRRGSGAAARALAGKKRALTTLSAIDLQAAVEGSALGAYSFTTYKSEPGEAPIGHVEVVAPAEGTATAHKATIRTGSATAESVIIARDLVNTPPNDLFPASFADRAKELA